ncbi:Alpha-1,6-glucosyltransferase [Fundidesulfovibrio magnetotacticus]|uniref:Alpha-1,6-glucosyltransferase n=1 Tax=Fundidesulfovibrio magnetotacticus TaxID=2730080 RepID=A0A6V8LKP8_9BACT|nr:glycosyltransferase family 1 protein [Fundidesulfovibrio magnetotacticus]GFK93272.1 Alpha-1,6-glucosyltransferase [Fundidesulfovibrio magnetotacticus]
MQSRPERTFFFIPPVRRAAGGVAVLWRMARFLREAGRDARVVLREAGDWRPDDAAQSVPEEDFLAVEPTERDAWVVPEGWVNALAPGLKGGARCLVYVQNWAYLFSGLPQGVDWRSLPVTFLAVSAPVAWFIRQSLGVDAPILRPGIDPELFRAPDEKPGELTVAYMPRKNKALADEIMAVAEARGRFKARFEPIAGLDQAGVARVLRGSHAFLATGFPEGCPLPPLEAMASGAVPCGFAGLGGWDYMRQAAPDRHRPDCPLEERPWGGNGFYVADNDVLGAALALEEALELHRAGGEALARVREACAATARAYSLEVQRRSVLDFWDRLG